MRISSLLVALLVAVANFTPVDASTGAPDVAKRYTLKGQKQAHPVLVGDIGPFRRAVLLLTQNVENSNSAFSGVVIVPGKTQKHVVLPLPPQDEPSEFFAVRVKSVLFQNVDKSPENEIIVLYDAQKMGPGEQPYTATCVYKWNGSGFVRLATVEAALADSPDGKAILAKLKSLNK
jgi:hypothetical protein